VDRRAGTLLYSEGGWTGEQALYSIARGGVDRRAGTLLYSEISIASIALQLVCRQVT